MADVLWLFGGAAVLVGLLANIAVWSPKKLRVKLWALGLAITFLPVGYLSLVTLLSRPMPIVLVWEPAEDVETRLIASQIEENEAIYLWVVRSDVVEPRAYVLPWDEDLARELHEAKREAEKEGGDVRIRLPLGEQILPGERMFYAKPRAPLPPKQVSQSE